MDIDALLADTHCHLTYEGLRERVPQVLAEARAQGVGLFVTVGTDIPDSRLGQALAAQYPEVFFSAGLHPLHATGSEDKARLLSDLRHLARDPKCVALGEMGMDRHYDEPPLPAQRQSFEWQLELARETGKPVIIHNRKATADTLEVLRASGLPGDRFVFHCFTGSVAEVEAILDFGASVGFTGAVTFKNAGEIAEASDRVPLERLLVETDAPYLTPEPHRGIRPNAPRFVAFVADFLRRRRGMPMAEFAAATTANARRFYRM